MSAEAHNCVFCDIKFPSKEELQDHFRKHASGEIKILTATERSGRFAPKPVEKSANSSQASSNLVSCDDCPESFDTVSKAIQHKHKKHPRSMLKHYCIFCGMQFPLKYSLDKHIKSHPENTGPTECCFMCLTCNFSFHSGLALNYHKKNVHNRVTLDEKIETPPASNKIKQMLGKDFYPVYYCHLCGCEYVVKFNLERHLANQHTLEEREALPTELVKCEVCEAIFFSQKGYENHLVSHKEDDVIIADPEERAKLVRMDLDFDPNRVQSSVDKYLNKQLNRGRRKPDVPVSDEAPAKVLKQETKTDGANADNGGIDTPVTVDGPIASADFPVVTKKRGRPKGSKNANK